MDLSDSNLENNEDFAEENRPRPPPEKVLYNGNGMPVDRARDVLERRCTLRKIKTTTGRSNNGVSMSALCKRTKTGTPVGIKINDSACNVGVMINCPACNVDVMTNFSLPKMAATSKDQPCTGITKSVELEALE